jgi:GrpB-like predicted nucleotidyltransferase (UPF0157 family)
MSRVIEVVDYDPVWIAAFEKEAAILNAVFGRRVIEVHHIGSTAVPALEAKPIIDILVVLDDTDDINSFDRAMEDIGYRVRGECLDAPIPGTPGRFYFSKETNEVPSHHVHVCARGHSEIVDKLAFRDYLRTHSDKAAACGELKRRITRQFRFDNIGYMHAKAGFVKSTLLEARRWYELNNR